MPDGNELAGSGMEQQYRVGRTLGHLSIKSSALLGVVVSARGPQSSLLRRAGRSCAPILLANPQFSSALTHNYPLIDTQPLQAVRATDQVQYLVGMVSSFLPHSLRQ
jgi:hypothetical protein